jgi:hypothetical protein
MYFYGEYILSEDDYTIAMGRVASNFNQKGRSYDKNFVILYNYKKPRELFTGTDSKGNQVKIYNYIECPVIYNNSKEIKLSDGNVYNLNSYMACKSDYEIKENIEKLKSIYGDTKFWDSIDTEVKYDAISKEIGVLTKVAKD